MRDDVRARLRRAGVGATTLVAAAALSTVYSSPAFAEDATPLPNSTTAAVTGPTLTVSLADALPAPITTEPLPLPSLGTPPASPNDTSATPPPIANTTDQPGGSDAPVSPAPPSQSQQAGGTLSGKVWSDENADGVSIGEPGVSGVSVTLVDADSGTAIRNATTAGDGSYSFTAVTGAVYVSFALPSGNSFTAQDAGNDLVDSDVDSNGVSETITATTGDFFSVDAGLVTQGGGGNEPTPPPSTPPTSPTPPPSEPTSPPSSPSPSQPPVQPGGGNDAGTTPSGGFQAPPSEVAHSLPKTGNNYLTETLWVGTALVMVGALLALVTRLRRVRKTH